MIEISPILDGLRAQFPDCSSIAYADLTTGMILAVSTDIDVPQETWDDLCTTAVDMLAGNLAQQLAPTLAPASSGGVCQAIIAQVQEYGVFVQSQSNAEDAFACLCAPQIEVEDFVAAAHAQLVRIDGDG